MTEVFKRVFDAVTSLLGLCIAAPVLGVVAFLIWWGDGHSPFYVAPRVGWRGQDFQLFKLRSMAVQPESNRVVSTKTDDPRITPTGHFVRRFKLDEMPQLWNVLKGDMSLVGPRPNVRQETELYTPFERQLLEGRPGITDFSSIIFSDLGDILKGQTDPNEGYRVMVRPIKSQLGVFYLDRRTFWVDIQILYWTAVLLFSRRVACEGIARMLNSLGANQDLVSSAMRRTKSESFGLPQ
jgi:lipopolysaccharide/colanic/teichoic acid biosynthesis glycosyltransferase